MIRCLCLCNCICILCQGMYMLKVLHSGVDPACCYWTRSHHTLQAFCPISPPANILPTSHNHLLANPYHGSSLNESAMSDISLFSASSPLSLFSPLLSTVTGRSHQGPHGGFSSGFGGCCPPVFNPGTLFALISGIALATYFLRPVYCSVCLAMWLWTENVNTKVGDCSDNVRGEGLSRPMGTLCTKW